MGAIETAGLAAACVQVRLLVLDIDGVLCDGRAWQDAKGNFRRTLGVRDSIALRRRRKAGYKVAILSASKCDDVRNDVDRLGADFFIDGCEDKPSALTWIARSETLQSEQIAIFTADERDERLVKEFGLTITTTTAGDRIKTHAAFVTKMEAGDGAVAEVCGVLLRAKLRAKTADGTTV